jgi:5-formyltetrahydrofolate cyclo-ligase
MAPHGPVGNEPEADKSRAKREAREQALSRRDALSLERRGRLSAAICARAAGLPELEAAGTLLLFGSFRTEIDTSPLIAWCLARGRQVCLPRVLGPHVMAAYRVRDVAADLEPGAWGIPEPRPGLPEVAPEAIDAVVVPGAAFDVAGRRCGYGGGFYDTYLPLTRAGVPRVALAFEAQIVDEVACESHDLAVDTIVTELRVIRCR